MKGVLSASLMFHYSSKSARPKGFSIAELLIYLGLFSAVALIFTGILAEVVDTNARNSSSNELVSQLNTVLAVVQKHVKDSSQIEVYQDSAHLSAPTTTGSYLMIRTGSSSTDPTCVYSSGGAVKLAVGPNALNKSECTSQTTDLTTNKIVADSLEFMVASQAGGHAFVKVDARFSVNTVNPRLAISKEISSVIGRANAAVFDSDLIPNSDNTFNIGQTSPDLRWRNGSFSGTVTLGTGASGGSLGIGTKTPLGLLDVVASSSHAFFVTSAGYIGIGTSAPSVKLDVYGGIKTMNLLVGTNAQNYPNVLASFGYSPTAPSNRQINIDQILNASTAKQYLFMNGTLGSATNMNYPYCTSPYAPCFGLESNDYNLNILTAPAGTNTTTSIAFSVNSLGNVGIGTSTPSEKLSIDGGGIRLTFSSLAPATIHLGSDGAFANTLVLGLYGSTSTGRAIRFIDYAGGIYNKDVLILNMNSGNVGIGTTAPGYKLQVGNSGDGSVAVANAWNTFSDIRFKKDIQPIHNALQIIESLHGVTFKWKTDNQPSIGFIAQQVQQVLPQIVTTNAQGYESLDYSKITPVLVEAVKQQQTEIVKQQDQINLQQQEIEHLKSRLDALLAM